MDNELREEFNKSSRYALPDGVISSFEIRNDYPSTDIADPEYPWLEINFEEEPVRYLEAVKGYCLLGMPENDFNVQKNTVMFRSSFQKG
jgi:hypothetical protein